MELSHVDELIEGILNDSGVPRNIRKALADAKQRLHGPEEANVRVSAAIYLIESISDDINMPPHSRTQIWALMSALESIKKG